METRERRPALQYRLGGQFRVKRDVWLDPRTEHLAAIARDEAEAEREYQAREALYRLRSPNRERLLRAMPKQQEPVSVEYVRRQLSAPRKGR